MKKETHELFARFFENPSREGLRDLLRDNVGEFDYLDFKQEWPSPSKLARHMLGFANSGGGCLVCGVDHTLHSVGLSAFADKADIQKGVRKYLPSPLSFEILDFKYDASEYPDIIGKRFQVVLVEDTPRYIPFVSESDGDDIRENAIYVRRGTNTEEATYDQLQEILNRRIETKYSSQDEFALEKELADLKTLYRNIPQYYTLSEIVKAQRLDYLGPRESNPFYPEESFQEFVALLIEEKKKRIKAIIGKRT